MSRPPFPGATHCVLLHGGLGLHVHVSQQDGLGWTEGAWRAGAPTLCLDESGTAYFCHPDGTPWRGARPIKLETINHERQASK